MTRIAIFASGSGSNAENIVNYFKGNEEIEIACFITNNPNAFVLERAKNLGVDAQIFTKNEFLESDKILRFLIKMDVNWVVLAGFLLKIPENLTKSFHDKIINIHPALLPKFGGKGMYGDHVHKAVIENKEKESGITIHFVNENYDEGQIIFQAKCPVTETDAADDLAKKIHELEYKHFPSVIENTIQNN